VDAYETHFGFREPPFSVTPDPRFFYANPGYREAYATLRYGVEERKGFVVVTGEAGTGKTTLLRMLMQHAGSSIATAFIFNPPHEFGELLRMILNELEVPTLSSDRVGMLEQFNDYLLEQLRKRRIVALLIDEAQALSEPILEELRLLSNLETSKEKLVQIVLMGQPELESKLDQPELRQLKQRVALRCRLEPLDREDVNAYIDFRLRTAGYEGKALFDAAGIENIARYSQGIPRLINLICEKALLRAFKSSEDRVAPEMVDEAAQELRLFRPRAAAGQPAAAVDATGAAERDNAAGLAAPLRYDFDAGERGEPEDAQPYRRSKLSRVLPVGIGLAVFLVVAAGLALHTQYSGISSVTPSPDAVSGAARTRADFDVSSRTAYVLNGRPESTVKFSSMEQSVPLPTGHTADNPDVESSVRPNNIEVSGSQFQSPAAKGDATAPEGSQRSKARSPTRIVTVTDASFVRETPRSDAEITSMLEPGTRVQVFGKAGEYFRVRALDDQASTGYVHQEDAFFEPSR
jgi:general secretion pathway protein A